MGLDDLLKQTDTVSIKRREFRRSLEFTSLCVEEEILREESLKGLLPLCCHWIDHGRWTSRLFHTDCNMIRFGSRVGKSDIIIEGPYIEDMQVSLQIFGGRWFIIESGIYNMLSVGGIRTRQAMFNRWGACLLQIGDTPVILNIPPANGFSLSGERIVINAPPPSGEDVYRLSGCGQDVSFDIGRTALLGSGESCDFKIEGEEFVAAISSFEGNLYLCPLFRPKHLKVDGAHAERLHPLHDGSKVEFGKSRIHVSAGHQAPSPRREIPNMLDVELCLLEVDEEHNCGGIIKLPPAGTVFSIGRGDENYVRIPNCNVSREHATAKINSATLILHDSYSRNGTFVNEQRIQKKTVHPGDIVRFGEKSYLLSFTQTGKELSERT